jgi:hypothetical protein
MWFLLKCLMVLALFYVLAASDRRASPTPRENAHATPQREPSRAALGDGALASLRREAAAKLGDAAREKCAANPGDCAGLLRAVGAAFGASRDAR